MITLNNIFYTILLIIFCRTVSFTQETVFSVLSSKGGVQVKQSADWQPIRTGGKISTQDKIKLSGNGYLALAHIKGKTLELKKAGEYDVSTLINMLSKNDASFNQKFVSYVSNEITGGKSTKKMTMLGAVSRAASVSVDIAVPNSSSFLDGKIKLSWYKLHSDAGFIFRIINPNDQTIFMEELKDTSMVIDMEDFKVDRGLRYHWIVSSAANENLSSGKNALTLLTKSAGSAIADTIALLKKENADTESPLNNYLIAKYYESVGLNFDAVKYFEKSAKLAPDNSLYVNEYLRFLKDSGCRTDADEVNNILGKVVE